MFFVALYLRMRILSILCILIVGLISLNSFAQNLASNASFEDINKKYLLCNYYQSNIQFDYSFNSGWTNPGHGTTDVYSTSVQYYCETYSSLKSLYRTPRTGDVMTGIATYSVKSDSYREYIQNKLLAPLIVGQSYRVSFYTKRPSGTSFVTNNMGIYFSKNPVPIPNSNTAYLLSVIPQIEYKSAITEYKDWVLVDTTFTATDAWKYLTIGNFRDDQSTQITSAYADPVSGVLYRYLAAYYFIDDVSVVAICKPGSVKNINICFGDPIRLQAKAPDLVKVRGWADSLNPEQIISTDTVLSLKTSKSGTYYFYYNTCDTLTYKVDVIGNLSVNLGLDKAIYLNQPITLNAKNNNATYLWQDNSNQATYNVSETGTYWVTVTDDYGCKKTDSIYIESIYLIMPNVFTPTGDHVNDHFVPMTMSGIRSAELSIYNRWGALVYKTNDLTQGWDGANAVEGSYFWDIKYTDFNGVNSSQKGELSLIRNVH